MPALRINPVRSDLGRQDMDALARAGGSLPFLMLPKVERPDDLALAALAMGETPLWPIVESAEGLRQAWDIASAPGVAGVLFGAADYSADIGCTLDWDALLYARGKLAAAAGRAGVQLLDVPHLEIKHPHDLAESTARSKALGFTGRACIHPQQVGPVNAVFTPTPAEVDRAQRVLEAFEAAGGGAALLDGKLIELPLVRAARRTLERAG
jgi:citrate lyase subunit beta/citryl-CoA lyase/(S)-citramalyl-CoA lyase